MASTRSSSSVDDNCVEEVTQGTSMTTREEIADDDIQDDDGSSCYQVILTDLTIDKAFKYILTNKRFMSLDREY